MNDSEVNANGVPESPLSQEDISNYLLYRSEPFWAWDLFASVLVVLLLPYVLPDWGVFELLMMFSLIGSIQYLVLRIIMRIRLLCPCCGKPACKQQSRWKSVFFINEQWYTTLCLNCGKPFYTVRDLPIGSGVETCRTWPFYLLEIICSLIGVGTPFFALFTKNSPALANYSLIWGQSPYYYYFVIAGTVYVLFIYPFLMRPRNLNTTPESEMGRLGR